MYRCFILIKTCLAISENGCHSLVLANSFVKESLVPFVVHDAELGRDVTKPHSAQTRLLLINELNCISAGVMWAPPNGACRYARRPYAESSVRHEHVIRVWAMSWNVLGLLTQLNSAHAENSGVMHLPLYGSIEVHHDAELGHDGLQRLHVLPFVPAAPNSLPPACSPDLSCCSVYESPYIPAAAAS